MFRRRRGNDAAPGSPAGAAEAAAGAESGDHDPAEGAAGGAGSTGSTGGTEAGAGGPFVRDSGPWDIGEVEDPAADGRIDLGGMWLPGREGMEMRLEVDEKSKRVIAVTAILGKSTLQLQPFAAPRGEGIWREVRAELGDGIVAGGGTVDEVDGKFGRELHAQVPVKAPDGRAGVYGVRFIGVDGPRWFLRGALSGEAFADESAAAELERLFRDVVVARGGEPMAPREALPLRLPAGATRASELDAAQAPGQESAVGPLVRGPEITETR